MIAITNRTNIYTTLDFLFLFLSQKMNQIKNNNLFFIFHN